MPKRINKDLYYLNIAKAVAQRSTCLKRHYGAVIVNHDEIIATGYNGAARNQKNCCNNFSVCPRISKPHNSGDYSDCPAVHAEQNAMLSASRQEMMGSTLYLYGEEYDENQELIPVKDCSPCPICARMIANAGILNVVILNTRQEPSYLPITHITNHCC